MPEKVLLSIAQAMQNLSGSESAKDTLARTGFGGFVEAKEVLGKMFVLWVCAC